MISFDKLNINDLIERERAAKRQYEAIEKAADGVRKAEQDRINAELAKRLGVKPGDKVTLTVDGIYAYGPQDGFVGGLRLNAAYQHAYISLMFTPAAQKDPNRRNNLGTVEINIRDGNQFEIKKRE